MYEYPTTPEAQEALVALDATGDLKNVEDMAESRAQLISTLPKTHYLRVTVNPVSFLDRGHYGALVREGEGWFNEKTSHNIDEKSDDPDLIAYRNAVYFRAEMLCAVARERIGSTTRYLAEIAECAYGEVPTWKPGAVPPEWTTISGVMEKMPVEFLDSWLDATRHLNAGVLSSIPDFLAVRRVKSNVLA